MKGHRGLILQCMQAIFFVSGPMPQNNFSLHMILSVDQVSFSSIYKPGYPFSFQS